MNPPAGTFAASSAVSALGQGFDTFNNTARQATAVLSTGTTSGELSMEVNYQRCESVESLKRALNISGSLSAAFGVGSVDVKTDFLQSIKLTATSLCFVIYARVTLSNESYTQVTLKDSLPSSPLAFYQAYGDCYVSQISRGREYFAVYHLICQSQEQRLQISASLEANGLVQGALDVSTQARFENVIKQSKVETIFNQRLFGAIAQLPDQDHALNFALNFSSLQSDAAHATVINYTLETYEHVPGFQVPFTSIRRNRRNFSGPDGLDGQLARLLQLQSTYRVLKSVYRTYGYTGDAELNSRSTLLDRKIHDLKEVVADLGDDPTVSADLPEIPEKLFEEPALNFQIDLTPPVGGDQGKPFSDVNPEMVVNQPTITAVWGHYGEISDGLSIDYHQLVGAQQPRSFTLSHGGTTGGTSTKLTLDPEERFTQVVMGSGPFKDNVRLVVYVEFKTSQGKSLVLGKKSHVSANDLRTFDLSQDTVLLGFEGHSGLFIDQLSLKILKLKPARWLAPLHAQRLRQSEPHA